MASAADDSRSEDRYLNLSTLDNVGSVWIEELKESQNVTNFVMSPLNFLIKSLGSLTPEVQLHEWQEPSVVQQVESSVGEYKGTVAGSELDTGIALCVPDGSDVKRGTQLKSHWLMACVGQAHL